VPAKTRFIITTTGQLPLADVVVALRKAGLELEEVMDAIGIVTGHCASSKAAGLRKVVGVSDVTADGPVGVGPPDAEIS
jgi:hypothetical protein